MHSPFRRDAIFLPSRCIIHPPREASFSPLSSHHLSLVSAIIYASCQPSYKPVKRAVAGRLNFFLPRLSPPSLARIGGQPIYEEARRSHSAPLPSEMRSLPMLVKDGWLSLGRKKRKRPATARFTGLYDDWREA